MKGPIYPVIVPRWGMTMEEGLLVAWRVEEGARVAAGEELLEIETQKIANTVEAPQAGILRRQVGQAGQIYPCGALLGVIAEHSVPEEEIAAFVTEHAQAARAEHRDLSAAAPSKLEVKGHVLRFLKAGEGGTPVLLIHGLGGDKNNWLFVQPLLAQGRATYAVDLPGHGESSKDLTGINSFKDVADVLVAFLDQLAIPRVHLVAHSMGAALALDLARRYADRVASLTLLSPAGVGVAPSPEFISGFIAAKSRREMTAVLKMLLADERQVSSDMVNELLKYKRLDGAEAALRRFAEFLSQETRPASEALAEVKSKVHIIWGTRDSIIPPLNAGAFSSNVRLTLIEGAGHMPHLEKSARTAEAIEAALPQEAP